MHFYSPVCPTVCVCFILHRVRNAFNAMAVDRNCYGSNSIQWKLKSWQQHNRWNVLIWMRYHYRRFSFSIHWQWQWQCQRLFCLINDDFQANWIENSFIHPNIRGAFCVVLLLLSSLLPHHSILLWNNMWRNIADNFVFLCLSKFEASTTYSSRKLLAIKLLVVQIGFSGHQLN